MSGKNLSPAKIESLKTATQVRLEKLREKTEELKKKDEETKNRYEIGEEEEEYEVIPSYSQKYIDSVKIKKHESLQRAHKNALDCVEKLIEIRNHIHRKELRKKEKEKKELEARLKLEEDNRKKLEEDNRKKLEELNKKSEKKLEPNKKEQIFSGGKLPPQTDLNKILKDSAINIFLSDGGRRRR